MTHAVESRTGVDTFAAHAALLGERSREALPLWLANIKKESLERFGDMGLPKPSQEEWRYTNVTGLATAGYTTSSERPAASLKFAAEEALRPFGDLGRLAPVHHLVFVNGKFVPELSRLDGAALGIRVEPLTQAWTKDASRMQPHIGACRAHLTHPFVALNCALFEDGAFIHVPDGVVVAEPIHVINILDASEARVAAHPRTLLVLGENAHVAVIDTAVSLGEGGFANTVTEALLGPHAMLDHYSVQEQGLKNTQMGNTYFRLSRGSQVFSHVFSFGGGLVRNELSAILDGDGAGATLDGLFLAREKQHVDNHTLVDHARPHCGSQELYKGILDGSGRGVFDGKIIVRPHAEKTDAHQKNRNLLLSQEALVDSKPQLEIYNNDVRCTHGATTGRLDADAEFYLRSRGLDATQARRLLTFAFGSEIVNRVKIEPLRSYLENRLLSWLPSESSVKEA